MTDTSASEKRSRLTVWIALAMDLAVTGAKFAGWMITGSSSLLAETFHSGAESANQSLLLVGRRRALVAEDPEHPFGFARERYFWPLIVSVLMFVIGGAGAVAEGIRKLSSPEAITDPVWAFVILGAAATFDGASWFNAIRQAREEKRGSYWEYIKEARRPEIPTILLQDTAAMIGLTIAAISVGLSVVLDAPVIDAVGSLLIGLLLGTVALVLAREMRSLLIGEAALPAERAAIQQALAVHPDVYEVISLRTLYLGPDDLLVEAKVRMADELDARGISEVIDEIEDRIRGELPQTRIISIEPDVPDPFDPERTAWHPDEG